MDDLDDDQPKKTPRATIVRRAIVGVLALACAVGWIYTRYLVKKETLGGPCSYDMHCRTEAPRCLKQSTEGEGVCSRSCDTDGDCSPDIKCVKVELDEYDDRGRPLQGGYCFPQSLLDARRKKKDGGTPKPKSDSWLDVPETPGQLEGEIVIERGGARTMYEVKGTLVRTTANKHARTIVDTTTLRVYTVDDEKNTFAASQIGAGPGEPKITKTDRKDTVADRECEIWQIEDGKSTREACVVKGGAFVDPAARSAAAWEKELTVRGVFPLRVTEGGKTKLVVVKVDAHPLAPSLFAIPKGYKNLAAH
ncbi:MAG TPA: DUF4412 domain-containing protein [Labilithrix sp.]|jgi:hypothetical protein|nr:DUF4412 domain-containing protein [Labilithrix sp.]